MSPLAAGLPGLVLVAWTVLYVSDVREAVRLIPLKSSDSGTGFELLLFSGLLDLDPTITGFTTLPDGSQPAEGPPDQG